VGRLRVALFASSSNFAARALDELAAAHDVVAIVRPARPGAGITLKRTLGLQTAAPLEARAAALGVPVLTASTDAEVAQRLRALRADLVCIALYPRRVGAEIVAAAPLGAINVHPSLLPRHRGPLPLFWTYHADDRVAGVTVHIATDRFDSGDIVAQEAFDLPRAYPMQKLDHDVAARAARMLREAASAMARGEVQRTPQDESRATHAPYVQLGEPVVPFAEWDVERVWHFLAALCPPYREPLRDTQGKAVAYSRVIGYRAGGATLAPGTVERKGGGLLLHCRGGVIELA
jgi:methionyl-tRNA formyltransferase